MVPPALLRVFLNLEISLSTVGTDGKGLRVSQPSCWCSLTVEVWGRFEKKKRGCAILTDGDPDC